MKRRTAIRNVVLMSAGAALLYACKEKAATVTLKSFPITGTEEDVLNELTEMIIPKTDFIGAKDLKTAEFILLIADDCMSPEEQKRFTSGLKTFADKGFAKMSAGEKKDFISKLDGDAKSFFETVKDATIWNFTTSQEYLAQVKNITTLIPPKFQACVPVNS